MHWRTHLLWQRVLLRDLVFPQPEMEEEFRRSEGEFQANFISFWILLSTLFWSVGLPVRCAKFGWFRHPDFAFFIHFIPIGILGLFYIAIRLRCIKPYLYKLLCLTGLIMMAWTMWSAHVLVQEEISMVVTGELAGVVTALRQNASAQAALRGYIVREQSRKYLWCEIVSNFLQLNLLQFLGLTFSSIIVFLSLPLSIFLLSYASSVMNSGTTEIIVMAAIVATYTSGLSYHMLKSRRRQFQLGYQLQHTLAKEADTLKEAVQREAALKEASQEADTILNHLLKNVMADAAGCIHLFLQTQPPTAAPPADLVQATECLERGVAWCRKRQAILRIASGKYFPQLSNVDLAQFCRSLLQGRPIEAKFPNAVVAVDPLLCEIVLDNALTNAQRHSHPHHPDLRFTASFPPPPAARDGPGPSGPHRRLTFTVLNRANPDRPPLTPELVARLLQGEEMPRDPDTAGLSDRLGLRHLCQAADAHGMDLRLEQTGDWVRLEVSLDVTLHLHSSASLAILSPSRSSVLPLGLRVLCVDDSPVARRLLIHTLSGDPLHASVLAFGETADEVQDFLEQALDGADIVILDYHLDYRHVVYRGTDLLRTLLDRGFRGLACIRSSNVSPFDEAMYMRAGAHCCIGKDVHPQAMAAALTAAYLRLHARRGPRPGVVCSPPGDDSFPSEPGGSVLMEHAMPNLPGCPLTPVSWKPLDYDSIPPDTHYP